MRLGIPYMGSKQTHAFNKIKIIIKKFCGTK